VRRCHLFLTEDLSTGGFSAHKRIGVVTGDPVLDAIDRHGTRTAGFPLRKGWLHIHGQHRQVNDGTSDHLASVVSTMKIRKSFMR
jgi:hypothetical protein